MREVLAEYRRLQISFDSFALLQPTTPLRSAADIQAGFSMMQEKNAGAVVAVSPAEHSISLYNTLPKDHSFVGFLQNPQNYARQFDQQYHRLNGALYLCTLEHFSNNKYIYDSNCYAIIMPLERAIDIDTLNDFRLAEAMMNSLNK